MLIYLLFYAFIPSHCAVLIGGTVLAVPQVRSTSEELSFPATNLPSSRITGSTKRVNSIGIRERLMEAIHPEPEQHFVGVDNKRDRYERDLMVVLPVMQGNSDLPNSKLQILYTKAPVTAIIEDDPEDLRQRGETISTGRPSEKRIDQDFGDSYAYANKPITNKVKMRIHSETLKEELSNPYSYAEFLYGNKPVNNKVRGFEKRIDTQTSKEEPEDSPSYAELSYANKPVTNKVKTRIDSETLKEELSNPYSYAEFLYGNKPVNNKVRGSEKRIDTETSKEEPEDSPSYAELSYANKPVTNKIRVIEKRIDTETPREVPTDRHPYTAFLISKPTTARASKSPLDYGYPESFKFVQELNELPKNHKPEWAVTDAPETIENAQTTKDGSTEDNPFQMYKSVVPLEINKLKPLVVSVTDSVIEETTVTKKKQDPTVKQPPQKRPTKKPQKSKVNTQKTNEDDSSSPTSTVSTTSSSTTEETTPTPTKTVETPSSVLPTPTGESVAALVKLLTNTTALSSVTTPSSGSTPLGLNLLWAHPETTTTELSPVKIVNEVKPSDLISLSRILGENFQPKIEPPTTHAPGPDDFLNNDMKNLMLALGILRSEMSPYVPFTTTRPTTVGNYLLSVFGKREPAKPTVDPMSYVTFKKFPAMPVEYERPRERVPVNDDMRDLLASFGLLPKNVHPFRNSIFSRMSRRRRLDGPSGAEENSTSIDDLTTTEMPVFNETSTNTFDEELELLSSNTSSPSLLLSSTSSPSLLSSNSSSPSPLMNVNVDMLPEDMRNTLENLGLILPLPLNFQPNSDGHVFQPSIHLDKLGDQQKIEKINEAIDHIRKLSKSKNAYNLTVEEIEKELENVTALLKENSTVADVTDELNTTISNATATKVVETLQKIPVEEDSIDNLEVNFTSDDSSISSINLNSTNDEETITELNVVMNPPNPLSPEELQHLLESNKNDIKRQQPNDTSPVTTTTEEMTTVTPSSSTSTSSSSTESSTRAESNNAPISDLADSFGGGETASEGPSEVDLTSTERPNGLYFYLDWNTFLTVGEPDKNPVRIRFAPKAGNARNFLPITVP